MKRLALLGTVAATLAIPASAIAGSTQSGVVLSVHDRAVQVVGANHVVRDYGYRGKLPSVRAGSEIAFSLAGQTISGVRVVGVTRTVSYYAHVVGTRSGRVVLRLADGNTISFAPSQISGTRGDVGHTGHLSSAAGDASIADLSVADASIGDASVADASVADASVADASVADATSSAVTLTRNLPAGTNVLVTETLNSDGSLSVALTIEPANAGAGPGAGSSGGSGSGSSGDSGSGGSGSGSSGDSGSGGSGSGSGSQSGSVSGGGSGSGAGGATSGDQTISGIVTDVQVSSFGIVADQTGATTRFKMGSALLAGVGMSPCDTVIVTYNKSGSGLVADSVDDNGSSDAGACDSDGTYYPTQDEAGLITSLSASSITIASDGGGAMTFPLLPSAGLCDGFVIGDSVDVSYSRDPDGTLFVADVEYSENDSTGVVDLVSAGQLAITDDSTGEQYTFTAPQGQAPFQGVSIGDVVDVTWHQGPASEIADAVQDLGPAGE